MACNYEFFLVTWLTSTNISNYNRKWGKRSYVTIFV